MSCSRQIICGELHYPRIPHQYWRSRLAMARAMGLNAVSTYVFWNRHEPREGEYDFSEWNDVAHFVRLAQAEGLDVVLRPGPYVCAEWDFGGLPAWLLRNGATPVRSTDASFMRPVHRWLQRLGRELAPLQSAHGGPIVAVQIENEYGAYGADTEYLRAIRAALQDAGFGSSPFYTIDQPDDIARGALDDVPIAVTFAPGNPGVQFAQVRALRPDGPLLCGEYWAGWFDHWGEPHAMLDEKLQTRDLAWMLAEGVSVNIYMFHGGTNFGFWNGANAFDPHTYQPTVSSYDYQAALDETGRPTQKFWQFREIIAAQTGEFPPPVPDVPAIAVIPECTLNQCAPLLENLNTPIESENPLHMEALGQHFGFILYRSTIPAANGVLSIEGVRDYAVVMVDGQTLAHLDRRLGESRVEVTNTRDGATLDILVENCGRINYGPKLADERKGIIGDVLLNGEALHGWRMHCLPFESIDIATWKHTPVSGPAFYRGAFDLDEPADTFLDTSDLGKGVVWVNGHNAGRFWRIGPQCALYIPAVWLHAGRNEVLALELFDRDSFPRLPRRDR